MPRSSGGKRQARPEPKEEEFEESHEEADDDFDQVLAEHAAATGAGPSSAGKKFVPANRLEDAGSFLSLWGVAVTASLSFMLAMVYHLRTPMELGVLVGAALVATLLSQPSFSAVAKAKFAAAVSQRKADPAHEAVYYSAFVNALAFLLVFVFAYAYLFPSAINGFEITALADPLVISAGSLLLPAGLLFAQSRSSRSLLV